LTSGRDVGGNAGGQCWLLNGEEGETVGVVELLLLLLVMEKEETKMVVIFGLLVLLSLL
jgi:hypothetical protein